MTEINNSIQLSGIMGPVLIALSVSEYLNFKIWQSVNPVVVYLNGLVLFILGLVAVQRHNIWNSDWTLIITIISWLCLMLGLFRMFFPKFKQLGRNWISNAILIVLFILGCFLTQKAYF